MRSHDLRQPKSGRAFCCSAESGHMVAANQRPSPHGALGPLKSMPDKPGLYKLGNMANTFQSLTLISLVMWAVTMLNRNISRSIYTNPKGVNKNKPVNFFFFFFYVSTGGGGGVYRWVPGRRRAPVGKPTKLIKGINPPSLTVTIYCYWIELWQLYSPGVFSSF